MLLAAGGAEKEVGDPLIEVGQGGVQRVDFRKLVSAGLPSLPGAPTPRPEALLIDFAARGLPWVPLRSPIVPGPTDERDELMLRVLHECVDGRHHRAGPR